MAKYTLKMIYKDIGKIEKVQFTKGENVVENGQGKEKQELFFIDHFIFEHPHEENKKGFGDAQELNLYLQKFGYPTSKHVDAKITYKSGNVEKGLDVIYKNDSLLQYFALYNLYWRDKISVSDFYEKLKNDNIYKAYQEYLLWVFENENFFNYLKSLGKEYVTEYTMDPIKSYRDNKTGDRLENKTAVSDAKFHLFQKVFCSYKQMRGMQLALYDYNSKVKEELQIPLLDEKEAYQQLKREITKEKLKTMSQNIEQKRKDEENEVFHYSSKLDEEFNANIGINTFQNRDTSDIFDEIHNTYDLNELPDDAEIPFDGRTR